MKTFHQPLIGLASVTLLFACGPHEAPADRASDLFTPRSDSALAERIAGDMAAGAPAVGVSAMDNLVQYDQGAALAAAKPPLRLINSDLWPTDLEALRRHNKNIGLAVMPGVGHFLMMEAPEEFNRVLARAVTELLQP